MGIDLSKALKKYKDRAGSAGTDWLSGYTGTDNKLARATSKEAQDLYVAKMKDPKILEKRLNKLKRLSEADLNKAAEAAGANAYNSGISAKGDKWEPGFKPIADAFDSTLKTLKPRTADYNQNIDNRVKPIVKAAIEASQK